MKYQLFLLVCSLFIGQQCLVAQGNERIFRSEDGGLTWQASAIGFPEKTVVSDFVLDGSCILAATKDDGLFISRDNGLEWSPIGSGLPSNISALVKHNELLFASPWRAGVYVSRDHGKTWQSCNFGLTDLEVNGFLSLGHSLYAATSTGIFYSWNNGKSWMKIMSAAQINGLVLYNGTLMAAGAKGVFRSADNGKTWQQVVANNGVREIYHSDFGLFASTYRDGLLRSLDEGQSWELAENGLPELMQGTYAFTQSSDRLLIGQLHGAYYSTTHGIHWMKMEEGLFDQNRLISRLSTLPNGVVLAAVLYKQGDGC